MALHIQFDDSAQDYLQKQLDIMQNIPAEGLVLKSSRSSCSWWN